ncbi:PEP/pyruvate-binding domain-containing protein [Streptomyces sp. NPDC050619]|uniref:PEP/pyruvate-binding domain-containing protein n=1 Tax=Streptomyces sp. NPDC050619 TaxID=3157214 RepID=UPI0034286130
MIETLDDPMAPEHVGWKFARLKSLYGAGVTVPPLFCLTGEAFHRAVAPVADRIAELLREVNPDDWQDVCRVSAEVRRLVEETALDTSLHEALTAAVDRQFPGDELVAVRSSVLAERLEHAEDSGAHAFAGMSDSFLYVPRDGIPAAVARCWSSAFSPEGLLYRHRLGLSAQGLAVAVGVQRMVLGERSLVLFTCDPATYERRTVISAGWGIGEGVVQEKTATDHFFVDRAGTVDRVVTGKTTMLTLDTGQGHGLREADVPEALRHVPVLSDAEAVELAGLGRRIEELFGAPQDIEATLTPDGRVHVVQSRPVVLEPGRHRVWSNANVAESFPGTTTPMTYSVARRFYGLLNHDYLRRCGVSERELHGLRETTGRLLGYVDGRIYHSITSFTKMLAVLPLFEGLRRDWERLVAELDTAYAEPAPPPATPLGRARHHARLARSWGRAARNLATLVPDFTAFDRDWNRIVRERRGAASADQHPLVLVADFREVWRRAGDLWGVTLVNYQFMVVCHKLIEQVLERNGVREYATLFSQLLCGGRQLKGAEIALEAVRLAERVRRDPELSARFTTGGAREVWAELDAGRFPAAFTAEFRAHLRRYGDRGIEELKLERPNLRDTPWHLVELVRQYVASGMTVVELEGAERRNRAEGEAELRRLLPDRPAARALLRLLFARLRTHLYHREAGRYLRSELFGYSKQVILALGTQLHQRGVLADPQDVFLLDLDELFGFVDGSGSTYDLAGLVEVRRRDLERATRLEPLREFATADVVALSVPHHARSVDAPDNDAGTVLKGLGSCPGRVRGRARVVLSPSLDAALEPDSILIARETDPGWLYLMLASRGIVVERGSMLSHTAITGRKFGIPTIVGVPGAMDIVDGSLLEIDGATGHVTVIQDAA